MPHYLTRSFQVAVDLVVLSVAYWLAFLFRFEFAIPRDWLSVALLNWAGCIGIQYAVLAALGVPRYSWRYISLREILRISVAVAVGTAVLVALRLGLNAAGQWDVIPLGVIGGNFVLAFVGLTGVRATRRLQGEANERRLRDVGVNRRRVLLIGAGQAGVRVARELQARPDLGLDAVGFLDDDRAKVGSKIGGLAVLGITSRLAEIAERKRVKRALITIANARGEEIRRITMACKDAGLDTKIIPGLDELVGDRINLSQIRSVAIEDLLGRDQVSLDEPQIEALIRDRSVLVTGAGGSIGSELCRQVARFSPSRLVLVERFENALFEIHREILASHPQLRIEPCVADVCDVNRMVKIFENAKPYVVFHAAAHKHVPMMEHNPGEAIKNNVGGTQNVANLADRFGVTQFVLISTDKAVNPSSVMGATKRLAETLCQARPRTSKTRFVTVRFGNVLGSNGSVIPIFKEQIANGGPVKVTHPEMQRYFMTIPEAAQLVMQAGAMGQGGEIFILDMGRPVKIVDLARDLITLSGLRPDEDIKIVFTGIRPGEKLFEELSTNSESADKTKHPKIFIGRIHSRSWEGISTDIGVMLATCDTASAEELRLSLRRLVPEYAPVDEGPTREPAEAKSHETTRASTRNSGVVDALPSPVN